MSDSQAREKQQDGKAVARASATTLIRIPKSAELVADAIRKMITGGDLKEGDTLQPEAQIIEEFAVSRPTVREAFRILESEKLISVSRGWRGGARVHVPKAEQLARYAGFVLQTQNVTYRDVYQARTIIEPPAARYVAETRSRDAPAILRKLIEEQLAAYEAGEFGRAVAAFHARLIDLTGNQTLILVTRMLDGIVARFQSEVARSKRGTTAKSRKSALAGLKSQERLVGFIEAGDGPAAEAHWRTHTANAARVWLAAGPNDAIVSWQD